MHFNNKGECIYSFSYEQYISKVNIQARWDIVIPDNDIQIYLGFNLIKFQSENKKKLNYNVMKSLKDPTYETPRLRMSLTQTSSFPSKPHLFCKVIRWKWWTEIYWWKINTVYLNLAFSPIEKKKKISKI